MKVYGLNIPDDKGLSNIDILRYVHELEIPYFRGVFMCDTLPSRPYSKECGIVNFNTVKQPGSHWICYYKEGMNQRIYFDSFGQMTLDEVQKYLKTSKEYETEIAVIQRNTDIVQHVNTHVCGHLCLFVLKSLSRNHLNFQNVLDKLNDGYTQGDW